MVKYIAIDAQDASIAIEEIGDEELKKLYPDSTIEEALELHIYYNYSSLTEWMVLNDNSVLRLKGSIKIVTL